MAIKIPESTASLTTRGTAPIQVPSSFTEKERASQRLLDASSQISDVFQRAIVTEQVSVETITFNEGMNLLEQKALSSPNLTESSSIAFNLEANKILSKSIDNIGDPQVAREFEVQKRSIILGKSNGIRKAGRVAQTDRYIVQTGEIKSQTLNQTFNTNNPVMQKIHRQDYINQLNRGVENLYISREERVKQISDFDNDARIGKPQHDFNILTKQIEGRSTGERIRGAIDFKDSLLGGAYSLSPQETKKFSDAADNFVKIHIQLLATEVAEKQAETQKRVLQDIKNGEASEAQLRILNANNVQIEEAKELSNDSGDLSNADLDRDIKLLAQFAPNPPTNNEVYQRINGLIDGDIDPATGRQLTPAEITGLIGDNLINLDQEDFQELDQRNIVTKRTMDNRLRSSESAGLKGRIRNQVIRNIDKVTKGMPQKQINALGFGEGLSTFANSIADEYSARFYRQALQEKATGDRIFDISNEIEQLFLKENGLWTGQGEVPNVTYGVGGEVIRHFKGKSGRKGKYKVTVIGEPEKEEEQ